MMGSSALSDLPPELLTRICDFMITKCEVSRFARCSRQFYGVAVPRLYRDIDLLSTDHYHHGLPNFEDFGHLNSLARAFQRNLELGHHVRHLALRMPDPFKSHDPSLTADEELERMIRRVLYPVTEMRGKEDLAEPNALSTLTNTEQSPAQETLVWDLWTAENVNSDGDESEWDTTDDDDEEEDDGMHSEDSLGDKPSSSLTNSLTEAERWMLAASRRSDVFATILLGSLLSCLPRLESLDIEISPSAWQFRFLDRVVQSSRLGIPPFARSPLLPNLKRLCFGSSSVDKRCRLWGGQLLLPSLEAIYMHRVSTFDESFFSYDLEPYSFNFTHLELRDCRIQPDQLRRILRTPRALMSFVYVLGEPNRGPEYVEVISYKSIRRALEHQKHSLERIWIDYPHDYEFDPMSSSATTPMGSFSGFTKLKHLHIASTYLFGFVWTEDLDTRRLVQALPEQIEIVHLSHADEDEETIEGVGYVIEAKSRGRFAQLRELKLDTNLIWVHMNRRELHGIVASAKIVGLEVKLFNNHSDARIEKLQRRFTSARNGMISENRDEGPWGFDEDVIWPERVSQCMKRPKYGEIPASLLTASEREWSSAFATERSQDILEPVVTA